MPPPKGESTAREGLKSFVKENSLSLFFFAIFLAALTGQAIAGHELYNQDQLQHHEAPISLWRYPAPRPSARR